MVIIKLCPLYQRTPMHVAAAEGHGQTVKFLIEKQADINAKDNDEVSITVQYYLD